MDSQGFNVQEEGRAGWVSRGPCRNCGAIARGLLPRERAGVALWPGAEARPAQSALASPRQTGMGLVAIFSRIGGIVTPLVMLLAEVHKALPMVIYGSLPIGAGLLCLLLPETRGQAMKDTIRDLEQGPRPR